jgi:hypothetical protein
MSKTTNKTALAVWPRFDRYVIDAGAIRPAPGAQAEPYDLWADYRSSQSATGAREPPYGPLLKLVQSIKFEPRPGPGPLRALSIESEGLVTSWCAEHGLLGILPHRTQMLTLAPRFRPLKEVPGRFAPCLHQYVRTNQGWQTLSRWGLRQETAGPDSGGGIVDDPQVPKSWPKPGALVEDLRTGEWKTEPLSKTWGPFFPDVPHMERDGYPYPSPGSEEFWRLYAEPVDDFVDTATLLLGVIQELGEVRKQHGAPESQKNPLAALDALNRLLGPTRPVTSLSNSGEIMEAWHTPSLLGGFAMMVLADLSDQRWPRTCDNCGKLFATKAYQGKYCSKSCRYAMQKRTYRQNLKARAAPKGQRIKL